MGRGATTNGKATLVEPRTTKQVPLILEGFQQKVYQSFNWPSCVSWFNVTLTFNRQCQSCSLTHEKDIVLITLSKAGSTIGIIELTE